VRVSKTLVKLMNFSWLAFLNPIEPCAWQAPDFLQVLEEIREMSLAACGYCATD